MDHPAPTIFAALCLCAGWTWAQGSGPPAGDPSPYARPDAETKASSDDGPQDEALGGRTARGTPLAKRTLECFPAETRNLFWEVDQTFDSPSKGHPLNFDIDGNSEISDQERNAIRGQNTWMLWGEGNEAFWGWLQERGYGLVDFLILLDSRKRGSRFKDAGLINQPGMRAQTDSAKRILGLYLDQADGERALMKPPPGDKSTRPAPPSTRHPRLFKPWDEARFEDVLRALPQDGADPEVYGYPSGIVGLRLMPNPDFFASTEAAARARAYWDERVVRAERDAYYTDPEIHADPGLIHPFRVSMACGFCHVGPHPMNPPRDPEAPEWSNLSSIIGNQYWRPEKAFANLTNTDNFLHHFLASQQPGTIDTSLVSTDHINNANTIIAIFDIPARLERAMVNPPEHQSPANLLQPGIEDGNPATNPRHTPRVLIDGADSIGAFGALSRVFLNIGTFPEEWSRCHNPLIGFKPQRPFSIAACQARSLFWQTAEKYRIPYLAAFFRLKTRDQTATGPMKLANAPGGREVMKRFPGDAGRGRGVFLQNCAVCHSSKQPEVRLAFSGDWERANASKEGASSVLTLPLDYGEWELFKKSRAYEAYVRRLTSLAGDVQGTSDRFLEDNFLSSEIRIPVTLVGTNSGRAVATNAMRGQVWADFSSEDYKKLPAVGAVRFFNPYSGVPPDALGLNDAYSPPGNGPGYYRPASLISLWATAPYLHNNSLGLFNNDPSIAGRLAAFEDGITRLLWNGRRASGAHPASGDLRFDRGTRPLAAGDPGFIYRTTHRSWLLIPRRYISQLLSGLLSQFVISLFTFHGWIVAALILGLLTLFGRPRHAAIFLALAGLGLGAILVITALGRVHWWLWLGVAVPVALALLLWLSQHLVLLARVCLGLLAVVSLVTGILASSFVAGRLGPLRLGPIPKGTPVNLIMNLDPEARRSDLIGGMTALLRGSLLSGRTGLSDEEALDLFQKEAGPALLKADKCPDFVLDRGHWFGEALSDKDKNDLIAFLATL